MYKILLVDDDEDDYTLTHDCLESALPERFTMEWANSAEKALVMVRDYSFDIVLVDHFLGKDLGINLISKLYAENPELVIIMITGASDADLDLEALSSGATDFITKKDLTGTLLSKVLRHSMIRKSKERQLKVARGESEEAKAAMKRVFANVTHEVRAPLISIVGMVEQLTEEEPPENSDEIIQTIGTISKSCLELINELLDHSKSEARETTLENIPIDVPKMLRSIYLQTQGLTKGKDIDFTLSCPEELPCITSDQKRLRQILINLISNAIKFTNQGSVTLSAAVEQLENRTYLLFQVHDTGIGMDADHLEHIFEPYRQADDSISRRFGGTGLGLAIVKNWVDMMGAEISVESELHKGSCFSLRLPFQEGACGEIPLPNIDLSSLKVLVVDDDKVSRLVLKKLIKRLGIESQEANDGRAALEKIDKQKFDVVLMDVNMPGLDGYETTSVLKHCVPKSVRPFIVGQTAHLDEEVHQECFRSGMDRVLCKPVDIDSITRVLKAAKDAKA